MQVDLAIHQSLLRKIQLLLVESEQKSIEMMKSSREKDSRVKESGSEQQYWQIFVYF